ncbi:hypothetical protein [Janibacter limosus]|uniref:hypothetical protein n=1 Tax=Janibacter limosus TaxID=53458 RepID=UPI00082C4406|nr:hypothetical protein [Janibacter limosus]
MQVSHGADTARLRQISQALSHQAELLADVAPRGSGLLTLLMDAWSGPDVEWFGGSWQQVETATGEATDRLRAFAGVALQQAEEQDGASGAASGGGGAGIPVGGPGHGGPPVAAEVSGQRDRQEPGDRGREAPGDARQEHDDRQGRDEWNGRKRTPESLPGEERPDAGPALGEPVPGTSLDEDPEPPPWTPVDGGAGEHDSEFAGPVDHATHRAARIGADLKADDWPNASQNLDHFLDNGGEPLEQDVDQMLEDVPALDSQAANQRQDLAADAVDDARSRGITEPVTYPVSTPWDSYYIGPDESADWFYATGGMEYSQTGSVTVYPPTEPGGPYRYEMNTTVTYQDQYNWDGSKETGIGPLTVSDAQLAALHRAGIAQEFEMYGESSTMSTSGEIQ